MFDLTIPAWQRPNLVEGGMACEAAHTLQPNSPFTPLETSSGQLPVLLRIPYVSRGNSAIIVWKGAGRMIIAFSGLAFENDGIGFIDGAASPVRFNRLPGTVNRFSAAWANRVRSALMDCLTNDVVEVWLYGHSMGSTQAHLIAWEYKQFRPSLRCTVVTYGSPKWCDFDAAQALMANWNVRVMATGDSMTYVCPTITQAPFFNALWDPVSLLNFARQVHLPNGILIDNVGNWSETDTPAGLTLPLDLNVVGFVRSMLRSDSPHNMPEMIRRMQLAFPVSGPVGMPVNNLDVNLPESERPPRLTLDQVQVQSANIQQWLDNRAPLPNWVKADRSRVTIERQGKRRVVKIDGALFYIATSKRDAKGVANATRAMMRQYVQQPGRYMQTADLLDIFSGQIAAPGNPDKPL